MLIIGGRALARLTTLAALGTAVVAIVAGMAPTAHAIDVTAPEAGITDPLRGIAPLDRNCKPGQVDVNTASAQSIGSALRINSKPTLDRIIAMRPWLKPLDLISVPGVPPASADLLVSRACATPTQLPMPTPLACQTNTSAVDLQSASADAIAVRLKLPRSVADALVAARPLPQDLDQVVTPRVPGYAQPKLSTLLANGQICVTPAVFTFSGTTWRWASEQHGAVSAAAGKSDYALIVPPRVVAGPTGAWASIKPRFDSPLPRASLHIHGVWTGEVGSRFPDLTDPTGGKPGLIHDTADGTPALSWGASVAREKRGTVVAPMRSLSDATAIDLSPLCSTSPVVAQQGRDDGSLLCSGDSPRDTGLHPLLAQRGTYAGRYVTQHPVPGPCGNNGTAISSGGLPVTMACFTSVSGSSATWTIGNYSGVQYASGFLTAFGSVVRRVPLGNHAFQTGSVTVDGSLYGLVGKEVATKLVRNSNLMLPGTTIGISKTRGSGPSTFRHDLSLSEWADHWTLFNLLQVLDAGLEVAGIQAIRGIDLIDCLDQIGANVDARNVTDCFVAVADGVLGDLEAEATRKGESTKARRLANLRSMAKVISRSLALPDLGASFIVQAVAAAKGSDNLTLEFLPPARPVGSASGGLADDGTVIVRTTGREGFLVNLSTRVARPITTGGDFLCYAQSRFVIDLRTKFSDGQGNEFLQLDPLVAISKVAAPSCQGGLPVWTYTPPPLGNTPVNVILRGADDGGVTSSWLINSRGEIQTIPDGGTYECLTFANPVIWNVPFDKIQAWPKVGTVPASCG